MNRHVPIFASLLLLTSAAPAISAVDVPATAPQSAATFNPLDHPLLALKYKDWAYLAAFSPDGRTLATEGDHTIRLTDLRTGEPLCATSAAPNALAMTFSLDGKALALASNVGTIEVLSLPTLVQDHVLRVAPQYNVYALAVSADSKRAAAANGDGIIQVFDIVTEKSLKTLGTKGPRNAALALSPDGQRLIAIDNDGKCIAYDTQTGDIIKDLGKMIGDGSQLRWDPAGKISLAASNAIYIWKALDAAPDVTAIPEAIAAQLRMTGNSNIPNFRPINAPPGDFAFGATTLSPDLTTAATRLENGNVALWDVATRKVLHILPATDGINVFGGGLLSLCFSPAGDLLATTKRNGLAQVWRIRGNAQPLPVAQPVDASILPGPWGQPIDGLRTRLIFEPVKPDAPNQQEGPPIPGRTYAVSQGVWWRVKVQIQNDSDKPRVFVWPEIRVPDGLRITRDGKPVTFLPVPKLDPVKVPHPMTLAPHGIMTANSILLGRMHDVSAPGKYQIQFPRTQTTEALPETVTNAILPASNVLEFTAEKQ